MKYCKDCWSFGSCKAQGRTVDFPVDDGVCRHFDPILPQTNADRIRAMSDEELAELLYGIDDRYCLNDPICEEMLDSVEGIPEEKCKGCLLKWLQQPCEGE